MTHQDIESTVPAPHQEGEISRTDENTRAEGRYVAPPVDIFETADGLCVLADLPGVSKDFVNIAVENGILTIDGRNAKPCQDDGNWVWREFQLTNYWRQFRLGNDVDQEKIRAEMKNGVLSIYLPKSEAVKPRKIDVQMG